MKAWICIFLVWGVTAMADEHADVEGTYMVPAGNHMDEAVYVDMTRARFTVDDDFRAKVDYLLPQELSGEEALRIVVEGTLQGDGPWYLDGDQATAMCSRDEAQAYTCQVFYDMTGTLDDGTPVFGIDTESAADYVDGRDDLSLERKTALKAASVSLMWEAIGVISFVE